MSPVGSFQEIGDYLRDREVTLALKDATTAWLSLAQVHTRDTIIFVLLLTFIKPIYEFPLGQPRSTTSKKFNKI